MSMTQFAMVEELAFLVKDNLHCKHLVLSVEQAMLNFLEADTTSSLNGTMELEPMNAYNRLLMHRLADIFGFSHESVGEGEERHLILERCAETSVPSILVSDILCQFDAETQSPTFTHQLLRRSETSPVSKTNSTPVPHTLEEREAAYLAARERIFSSDSGGEEKEPIKRKPRHDPAVARRMIAHALGKRISPCNNNIATPKELNGSDRKAEESNIHGKDKVGPNTNTQSSSSPSDNKVQLKQSDKISAAVGGSGKEKNDLDRQREHLGAAKRMFAHALGMQAGISKPSETRR